VAEEKNIDLDEELIIIDERRRDERTHLVLDLYFNGQDATGVASLFDISLGGLFMRTVKEIAVGSYLHLRIPFGENRFVVAKAEVVYTDPGQGVGVKFIEMSDESRKLLERKLAKD